MVAHGFHPTVSRAGLGESVALAAVHQSAAGELADVPGRRFRPGDHEPTGPARGGPGVRRQLVADGPDGAVLDPSQRGGTTCSTSGTSATSWSPGPGRAGARSTPSPSSGRPLVDGPGGSPLGDEAFRIAPTTGDTIRLLGSLRNCGPDCRRRGGRGAGCLLGRRPTGHARRPAGDHMSEAAYDEDRRRRRIGRRPSGALRAARPGGTVHPPTSSSPISRCRPR